MSDQPQIVLHIGTMKSGTTYLQHGILTRLAELESAGWLYPLEFAAARGAINHERAIYGLVGNHIPWVDQQTQQRMRSQWLNLKTQIHKSDKSILISAEALASMLEEGIELLLSQLPNREIKIVITARDLARVLPSSWQQSVRNGRPYGYEDYFERIKRAAEQPLTDPVGSNFWRSYQLNQVVQRWSKFVPISNITIVTVPPKQSSDSLWARFIAATKLPLDLTEPTFDDKRAHAAISWPEAEVLNELNLKWAQGNKSVAERNKLRRRIIQEGFHQSENRGRWIGLTAPWLNLARAWADADVAKLIQLQVQVVGDINELRVDPALEPVEPCLAAEMAAARAAAARFHDRIRLRAITRLFNIPRKSLR